jgi:uncharacterized lipoprotein YajG
MQINKKQTTMKNVAVILFVLLFSACASDKLDMEKAKY